MRRAGLAVLVVMTGCAHAPPRATTLGKRVGLGEVVGDPEAKGLLKEALREVFELDAPNPELHLHVDATTSGFDEQVLTNQPIDGRGATTPRMHRRVQTMHVTFRLVEDATGEVLALGVYDELEKGPQQPPGARDGDDLGVILARRVVRRFVASHHF